MNGLGMEVGMANRQIDPDGYYNLGVDDARLGNDPDFADLTPAEKAEYLNGYNAERLSDAAAEWSGSPDPADPDNFWIDDLTGERVSAATGERSIA
jgi:hypothetical protein